MCIHSNQGKKKWTDYESAGISRNDEDYPGISNVLVSSALNKTGMNLHFAYNVWGMRLTLPTGAPRRSSDDWRTKGKMIHRKVFSSQSVFRIPSNEKVDNNSLNGDFLHVANPPHHVSPNDNTPSSDIALISNVNLKSKYKSMSYRIIGWNKAI